MTLTRRNRTVRKPGSSSRPCVGSPMCGGPNPGIGDMSSFIRARAIADQRAANEKRSREINEAIMRNNVSARLAKQIGLANRGCFIAADGKRVCNPSKGGIFVSPEQFARNLDTFIKQDLPKAGTGVLLAGLSGFEVPLVIAAAAAATRGITFEEAGVGPGR